MYGIAYVISHQHYIMYLQMQKEKQDFILFLRKKTTAILMSPRQH